MSKVVTALAKNITLWIEIIKNKNLQMNKRNSKHI